MPSPTTPVNGTLKQDAPKVRRFAPEPIETTTKSSKSARTQSPEKKEAPKVRRFAPEPIETTTKSSRGDANAVKEKSAPRRFAPQPIETSHKSSKDRGEEKAAPKSSRFKPQLVETTHASTRGPSRQTSTASDAPSSMSGAATPRKFVPVILSTAKRSRRAGEGNVVSRKDMKTEEGHAVHARELQKHAGWVPEESSSDDADLSPRSREFASDVKRQVAPLDGKPGPRHAALTESRSHSFRCPDLDTIESSESERESGPSSRSMSPSPAQGSPITASDSSFNEFYKHATRIRESVDENFSQYFLQLEAKRAERRLQEAALAAFPNSDFHEPVQHYVNDDQDSLEDEIEDRPVTWEGFDEEEFLVRIRRDSTKVPWEQMEMQRHAERMEQERNANKTTAKKENSSPWWEPVSPYEIHQTDNEMRSMRDRARPPMLGNDLVFARCPSPEPARFDVTQGSDKLRVQMLNQSQQASISGPVVQEAGLWVATTKGKDLNRLSADSKGEAKSKTGRGLWGGFCVGKTDLPSAGGIGLLPPPSQTGLMTPGARPETANPFEQSFAQRNAVRPASSGGGLSLMTPPTPPPEANPDISRLDSILSTERDFEETFEREYPDSFITQVYNYLSLGYPSLARAFDDELSKISRIPVAELRQDDIKAKQNPRGYIRLDPDFEGGGGEGIAGDACMRWRALKLYVREWARQEKDMVRVDAPGGNWATVNRRGSWAI